MSGNPDWTKNASTAKLKSAKADMQKLADSYIKGSQPNASEVEKREFKEALTLGIDDELKNRGQL